MNEGNFHCISLEYLARREIRSLPRWHGARWHAMLREACHKLPFNLEEVVLACRPVRNGKKAIRPGEKLALGLLVSQAGLALLPRLLQNLSGIFGKGEFSADSLELLAARDSITGRLFWQPNAIISPCAVLFHEDFLFGQAAQLASLEKWTLRFLSPLRLPLPGHIQGGEEKGKYASPEFLASREGLERLLRKTRFLPGACALPVDNLSIQSSSLKWEDMRYGQSRHIALGGVTGQIEWTGKPAPETSFRLVAGSVLGAGKNPRFGLGFWEIPEIQAC